jgi:hypothetical protein
MLEDNIIVMEPDLDEHIIRCNICGRRLIVKDNINNGVAFLSHLKNDHGISYNAEQSVAKAQKKQRDESGTKQVLESPK